MAAAKKKTVVVDDATPVEEEVSKDVTFEYMGVSFTVPRARLSDQRTIYHLTQVERGRDDAARTAHAFALIERIFGEGTVLDVMDQLEDEDGNVGPEAIGGIVGAAYNALSPNS